MKTIKTEPTDRKSEALLYVARWPKQIGRADYIRYLKGERITRDDAIKAKCYECVGGEDTAPCNASICPLVPYSQWNK